MDLSSAEAARNGLRAGCVLCTLRERHQLSCSTGQDLQTRPEQHVQYHSVPSRTEPGVSLLMIPSDIPLVILSLTHEDSQTAKYPGSDLVHSTHRINAHFTIPAADSHTPLPHSRRRELAKDFSSPFSLPFSYTENHPAFFPAAPPSLSISSPLGWALVLGTAHEAQGRAVPWSPASFSAGGWWNAARCVPAGFWEMAPLGPHWRLPPHHCLGNREKTASVGQGTGQTAARWLQRCASTSDRLSPAFLALNPLKLCCTSACWALYVARGPDSVLPNEEMETQTTHDDQCYQSSQPCPNAARCTEGRSVTHSHGHWRESCFNTR